ncbi:RagB/SusD family nutrient uptake outer membrane protein [Flammeovirgaceae bacterium SG7u.111]|nr:RagB/SusD family nutrient uptake outer membrane protein [Flammeovirgaceae bacterium SG7u.132]WPO33654.1 RagB/SusD family nutrient uptake outer membrane protein [Flammeovirgaceae bacterium SG7u.111]
MKSIYKKTIALALIFIGLSMMGCNEEILNQSNPNALTPSSFWKSEEDATKGIIGAYSPFTHIWYYTRFEIFLSDYRDDVVNAYGTSERTAIGSFNGISTGNGTFWVWSTMYQCITRANEVIYHVPNIEMNTTLRDNIIGEAHFIRAYNYFGLVNNWLNIPLITEPISEIADPVGDVSQADPEAVWTQIISDLQKAETMLPASWADKDLGRVTTASASALLGKVLLYRKDYAGAKAAFQKVIDNPNYSLVDDYGDNFTEDAENNRESLFEIQLVSDGNNGWGGDAPGAGKGAGFHPDLAPAGFTGQDGMRINDWVLDLFLDERTVDGQIDPRAFYTLFWDTEDSTTYQGKVLKSRTYLDASYQDAFPGDTRIFASKHLDVKQGYVSSQANGWHQSGNNLRILRYADVLLMYAEAEFMLNGSSAIAVEAVNEVRRRVNMPEFASITMQDIEDERVKELSLERTRYFDILRWGKIEEYLVNKPELKSESSGTGAYKPGREYIDIPQNEIDANPKIKHNPGY